ncbi:histidine triad (HIT) protein [Massilia sp. Root418]|jgi:diadenosine tetraphosphate (Ap4A) HIT family hydrolase|uniref:HIT family protein n=1 Tax=Massilia sp. Root418 TaxID=1736532 RepID=UPI0006F4A04A|nr:HIT family protein [Massilia sp. Root418]KQW87944.1 histidine triad (HIT) protein [Massilia sp. Root418]
MTQPARACDLCTLLAAPADALVWRDDKLSVVLVDEASYPGFVRVVWNQHVKEMTDLAPADRAHVMNAVWQVEAAVRAVMAPAKVNLASFGNMTPHVHWHVIPRYTDDVHFPNPTWGEAQRAPDASAIAARGALLPQLRAAIAANLSPAS